MKIIKSCLMFIVIMLLLLVSSCSGNYSCVENEEGTFTYGNINFDAGYFRFDDSDGSFSYQYNVFAANDPTNKYTTVADFSIETTESTESSGAYTDSIYNENIGETISIYDTKLNGVSASGTYMDSMEAIFEYDGDIYYFKFFTGDWSNIDDWTRNHDIEMFYDVLKSICPNME